jgi:hypothetical protein
LCYDLVVGHVVNSLVAQKVLVVPGEHVVLKEHALQVNVTRKISSKKNNRNNNNISIVLLIHQKNLHMKVFLFTY